MASAQTDVTTGRISGTVKDAEGGGLPGVIVEARNENTGLTARDTTREDGFYQLFNLPTGAYTLVATMEGFQTATTESVSLVLGSSPTVNFVLQLLGVAAAVTVTGEIRAVEVTNTAASTTIRTEQIKDLPVAGRDFRTLVLLTPQTRFDRERGNISIAGERGINTNVTVDGVDFNNAFFGGTVGGAEGRAPLSISQESIKEFTVITNGASVEFGRTGGGVVNVITKSGTNEFHGSAFYYWQPQELISDFADGTEPGDQEKKQYGASFGGRIIRDRLFFFASYDQQDRSETVPIDEDVLDPRIFERYPELSSGDQYASTQDGDVTFGRLDFQAGAGHRFMVRGNLTDYEGVNGTSTSQSRTDTYNGIEGLDTEAYVASYSGQFGSSLINDLNINYITEDTPREDKGLDLPAIFLGAFSYGEVSFLPIVSTTEREAIGDTVTYLLKDHVLKGGVEYNDTSIDQVFRGNWRGVFIFQNTDDFLAGRWSEYRQFGGLQGLTSEEAGNAAFHQKELAFFAQDQWFVSPNLTVTAGVRWERLDNPDDPILNPFDQNPDGSFRLTGRIPDSDNQWSPRLGISWSPDDQKTVLRLTAGRYWSRTPALLWAQPFTSNGSRGTQYNIFAQLSPDRRMVTGPPTDPLSPGWGDAFTVVGTERIPFTQLTSIPPRPGVFYVDPGFENPYTDRYTFGVERQLDPRMVAALSFTYAQGNQLQRLKDINRVYEGTLAANGLPRYSSTTPFPYYGRITTSVSDAESEYLGATASFQRRFVETFMVFASATWSRDRDHDSNERNFAGIQAEDYNDVELNWGYSDRDQRWRASTGAIWNTPWWGIELAGSFRYNTGQAFNATANADLNNDGVRETDRPTVGGSHFERNRFRQPDFYSLEVRLGKVFRIGPGELKGFIECFNCTDADNRFVLGGQQIWGTGETPPATFGQERGVGTPRTFQVALRFDF
jgi:outer membrane receptor protein involved in Fe transport